MGQLRENADRRFGAPFPARAGCRLVGRDSGIATIEIDNDVGQVTLLEFRPHRWLFALTLPTVNEDR